MSLLLYTSSEDATENVKFSASQHQSNDELKWLKIVLIVYSVSTITVRGAGDKRAFWNAVSENQLSVICSLHSNNNSSSPVFFYQK